MTDIGKRNIIVLMEQRFTDFTGAAEYVKELIENERPQGEWAEFEGGYRCSNCDDIEVYTPNFCPNCGADMRAKENKNV